MWKELTDCYVGKERGARSSQVCDMPRVREDVSRKSTKRCNSRQVSVGKMFACDLCAMPSVSCLSRLLSLSLLPFTMKRGSLGPGVLRPVGVGKVQTRNCCCVDDGQKFSPIWEGSGSLRRRSPGIPPLLRCASDDRCLAAHAPPSAAGSKPPPKAPPFSVEHCRWPKIPFFCCSA